MEYLSMKRRMSLISTLSFFLLYNPLAAAPSTNVAWTSEVRAIVAAGDPERGRKLAAQCAGCHGDTGISPTPLFPSLAGQRATYTYKQLKDYKDEKRADNPMMSGLAKPLDDQKIADLAAFYAAQPLPAGAQSNQDLGGGAQTLVWRGDGKRLIPPCASCHGRAGQGNIVDVPSLAGQQVSYFSRTMQAYKTGKRANDSYKRMRLIAGQLTGEEIGALAKYYAAMGSQ
jgi:cytochrome c553